MSKAKRHSLPLLYRLWRGFFRFLSSIWFREINLVDDEYIAEEGGVMFVTWHPNGLIDPMLLTAMLPRKLTTVVQSPFFRIPFVGLLFRSAGMIPLGSASKVAQQIGLSKSNAQIITSLAEELAHGGQILVFPEEDSHISSTVQRIRSGAARIILEASRIATTNNLPQPRIIPVGLHYSASREFRERAAIVLEREMHIPDPPTFRQSSPPSTFSHLSVPYAAGIDPTQQHNEDLEHQLEGSTTEDVRWIEEMTKAIGVELQRANLAKTTWEERTLIWKGRGLVQAEKQRQYGQKIERTSYAESVLAARRLRAGWEFMLLHERETADRLSSACEQHFHELSRLNITPHDVDSRPPELTQMQFLRVIGWWLWSVVWMFGLVTWGAIIGSYVPYKSIALLNRFSNQLKVKESFFGSIKVMISVIIFPLWWTFLSATAVWFLLDNTSPVYLTLSAHQVLKHVTQWPSAGIFIFFMVFWPLTARAQMKLFARCVRSTRSIKQWFAWRDASKNWQELASAQHILAAELVNLGAGLVLPGDKDWQEPATGQDDVTAVLRRQQARSDFA